MSDTEPLPKPEPVRRLEVFTGAGRRRRWTAAQKAAIVAESHGDGETACAVARRHGLTPQQLFAWRRALRQCPEEGVREAGLAFAPVIVTAPQACPSMSQWAIEIVVRTTMVRVASGADAETLQTVLRAVKALS